jgi:hypothetical protein
MNTAVYPRKELTFESTRKKVDSVGTTAVSYCFYEYQLRSGHSNLKILGLVILGFFHSRISPYRLVSSSFGSRFLFLSSIHSRLSRLRNDRPGIGRSRDCRSRTGTNNVNCIKGCF